MRGLFLVFAISSAVLVPAAWGFGTVHGFRGQDAEHERITRHAFRGVFEPETLSMVAGANNYFGAVGAPDNPLRSHSLVSVKAAHCDGGDYFAVAGYPQSKQAAANAIINCRTWMNDHLNAATDAAAALIRNGTIDGSQIPTHIRCVFDGHPGRAKCNVLEEFGIALHAAQDFYSHSNWVDRAGPGAVSITNPPGLGNAARSPWLNLRQQNPTLPDGLITGCFDGPRDDLDGVKGCPGRVTHYVLNKDLGQIDPDFDAPGSGRTIRGSTDDNFHHAAQAAIDDTIDKWQTLRERIVARYGSSQGNLMVCAITNDDPEHTCH